VNSEKMRRSAKKAGRLFHFGKDFWKQNGNNNLLVKDRKDY
jgi:hypothetical protein